MPLHLVDGPAWPGAFRTDPSRSVPLASVLCGVEECYDWVGSGYRARWQRGSAVWAGSVGRLPSAPEPAHTLRWVGHDFRAGRNHRPLAGARRALPAATRASWFHAKDKEQTIERALRGLHDQTVADGGYPGGLGLDRRGLWKSLTPAVTRSSVFPAEAFTYGHALNLGSRHASGQVVCRPICPLRSVQEPSNGSSCRLRLTKTTTSKGPGAPHPVRSSYLLQRLRKVQARRPQGSDRDMGVFEPRMV